MKRTWTPKIKRKWKKKRERNPEREKLIKEKHKRIKEGKFESEEEKFKFSQLLQRGSGSTFSVKIGLQNVYKKPHWKGSTSLDKRNAIRGQKLLQEYNIPFTKFKRKQTIFGKERLVFEKARDLTKKEVKEKIDEIINLAIDAGEKEIMVDINLRNLGINKEGQIVIRDTDRVAKLRTKKEALHVNMDTLRNSLRRKFFKRTGTNKDYLEIMSKIDKIKKQKEIK